MKSIGIILILSLIVGCSAPDPKYPQHHRWDNGPFAVGDVVRIRNGSSGRSWIIEQIDGDGIWLIRENVTASFWSSSGETKIERQKLPAALLERYVCWWNNEPEPEHRR